MIGKEEPNVPYEFFLEKTCPNGPQGYVENDRHP